MDSLEYTTLTQCYPKLIACVQLSPNDISVQLRPSGILAPSALQFINNPHNNNDQKARKIINSVLQQVQINPNIFDTFVSALKAAGPWTKTVVRQLEQTHTSFSATTNTQTRTPLPVDSTNDEKTRDGDDQPIPELGGHNFPENQPNQVTPDTPDHPGTPRVPDSPVHHPAPSPVTPDTPDHPGTPRVPDPPTHDPPQSPVTPDTPDHPGTPRVPDPPTHDPPQSPNTIFDEAMEEGYVNVRINTVLLFGAAGTGKTSTKHLILGLPPPKQRNSTPVAESAKCVHVRDVSATKIQVEQSSWKEVKTLNDLKKLTSDFFRKNCSKSSHPVREELDLKMKKLSDVDSVPGTSDYKATVIELCSELRSQAFSNPESTHEEGELLVSNWVYMIDSGGQPHFYSLLPHFIKEISTAVYVLRLIDRPDDYPEVAYYKKGVLQKEVIPYQSKLNNAEHFTFLVQSIKSCNNDCRLVCIGTHWDKVKLEKKEDLLEENNSRLLKLLPKNFKESEKCVYKDRKLVIPVEALIEDNEAENKRTKSTLELQEILWPPTSEYKECIFMEIKVPAWWYYLELHLKTQFNERKVLRYKECEKIAHALQFHKDALIAALKFFHEHHIFHYYSEVLPDVVFCDPQVLLDIVTELVEHAAFHKNQSNSGIHDGSMFLLINEGIVTKNKLNMQNLSKHYEKGLFEPQDLIRIFEHLLILTEKKELESGEKQYIMPALLESLPESDLEKYRLPSSPVAPLIISFKCGYVKCGVFCCLQVYLIKNGWEISDKPKQNCVVFLNLSKRACSVTLINHFKYLEIYVNADTTISYELCPRVKDQILLGIRESHKILRYTTDNDTELAFFCLFDSASEQMSPCWKLFTSFLNYMYNRTSQCMHIALVRDDYLVCTEYHDHRTKLQDKHKFWFDQTESQNDSFGNAYRRKVHFVWDHLMLYRLKDEQLSQINGAGIAIAILDTGIDPDHIAIKDNIKLIDGVQTMASITNKDSNHGTSMAGIAAGKHLKRSECAIVSEREIHFKKDSFLRIGVAPKASLVIFRVTDNKEHYKANLVIKALNEIIECNKNNTSPKIEVVVMSFQLDFEGKDKEIEQLLEKLRKDEVLCLAAAGNQGHATGLGYPATSDKVLTIGASTKYCNVADFSSKPVSQEDNKDIVSIIGEGLLAPITKKGDNWKGLSCFHYPMDDNKSNCLLETVKGTSYSAPAMAGLIAILLQLDRRPERTGIGLDKSKDVITRWKSFFKEKMYSKIDPAHQVIISIIAQEFLESII